MALKPRHETFAQEIASGKTQTEAYRIAFGGENASIRSAPSLASRAMADPAVIARVQELQAEHAERNKVTVDSLVRELEEARQAALRADTPQTGAAVSATLGKAKLLGLDKQLVEVTGKNGAPFIADLVFVRAVDRAG